MAKKLTLICNAVVNTSVKTAITEIEGIQNRLAKLYVPFSSLKAACRI
jgi:hypothetical protein